MDTIDIVFDGPPSHVSGRFVEVENSTGASIKIGEWVHRPDGYWVLRIPDPREISRLQKAIRYIEETHAKEMKIAAEVLSSKWSSEKQIQE